MKRLLPALIGLLFLLAACFKEKMLVVGPPTDIDPNDTTSAPDVNNIRRKVLYIGISGVRGDAMKVAQTPNMTGMLPHAVYSFDALTQPPTTTGAGWTSTLTGVWSEKHGVTDDSFSGSNLSRFPMAFKYVKALAPHLRTVSVQSWPAVNDQLIASADVKVSLAGQDAAVRDSAVGRLKTDNADMVVVGFSGVLSAAHDAGYGPDVPEYMSAISTVDAYVGDLLAAIESRATKDKEDWLVIISSDHGGIDNAEGSNTHEERNIFTIFFNKKFGGKEVVPPLASLKAVRFASTGEYAYSNDPLYNFDSIKKFTVQLSIRSRGFDSDPPFIGNKDWNSGGNKGWLLCPKGSAGWKFQAGDGSGGRVDVNSTGAAITDNKWHTLAFTVDRSSGAGELALYQDGLPAGGSSLNNLSSFAPQDAVTLAVGDDITGNYRGSWGNADFQLANIRIWDTVWTKEDMQKYSHCDTIQTNNPYYSRIIGWWKATSPTGSVLTDVGPLKKDLLLHGSPQWVNQEIDFCNTQLPAPVPQSVDVVPTVFAWLHITADPSWGLDGISWLP
ncbi:hypothetical protein MMC2321_03582 [Chitinophaga sp. MM2321]